MRKLYSLNKNPSNNEMSAIAARWSPYQFRRAQARRKRALRPLGLNSRTMVTWYIWRWFP